MQKTAKKPSKRIPLYDADTMIHPILGYRMSSLSVSQIGDRRASVAPVAKGLERLPKYRSQ